MSLDYRSLNLYPIVKVFTAIQTATEIEVPQTSLVVMIGCEQHDIYWATVGTDGQILGQDKVFMHGGSYMQIKLGRGKNRTTKIYIMTKSASSADVTLIFEE